MKPTFKYLMICLFALFCFNSCQDETVQETESPEESIAPNSTVANLVRLTVSNDGSVDNVMDNTDCFSINLPVTIVVNDITITINTLDDLELIEEIFDEYEEDEDFLEFLFPITIILNDYTEIVIENEEQLEDFIEECTDQEDDIIECVDFVYPISFSIYNADFQLIDTVEIDSDQTLYEFLNSLQDDPNGAVIASLNYPVSLIYADGSTVEVNSNQELEAAINAAEEECEDDNEEECNEEDVAMYLQECFWNIVAYNGDDHFIEYDIYFNENGTLEIINGDTTEAIGGEWEMSVSNDGLPELVISNLTAFSDDLEGSWIVVECEDDRLEMISGDNHLVLESECSNNQSLIECYSLYIDSQECDDNNDGTAIFIFETEITTTQECQELYPLGLTVHSSYEDAENGVNPLNVPLTTPIEFSSQTFYVRIYSEVTLEFAIQELVLVVESCNSDFDCPDLEANFGDECEDANGSLGFINENCECEVEDNNLFDCFENLELEFCDDTMPYNDGIMWFDLTEIYAECENDTITVTYHESLAEAEANIGALVSPYENTAAFTQGIYARVELIEDSSVFEVFEVWLNIFECDPFECFGDYGLFVCDEDDGVTDGLGAFDLDLIFANCPNDNVEYYFYETIADAENQVNPLVNPYVNVTQPQVIYSRVELVDNNEVYEIFVHELIVEVCNPSGCTEQEVDAHLVECIWDITSYNGSDDLIEYNFDFENNTNIVIIYTDETTIDATWSTSQTNDGVIIEFSNVNGANIQAITGEWLVVECAESEFILHRNDDEMIMQQNCN